MLAVNTGKTLKQEATGKRKIDAILPDHFGPTSWNSGKPQGSNFSPFLASSSFSFASTWLPASSASKCTSFSHYGKETMCQRKRTIFQLCKKTYHVAKVDSYPQVYVRQFNSHPFGRNVRNACHVATAGKLKGQNISHPLNRKKKVTQSCSTLSWKHVEEGVLVPRAHDYIGDQEIR